MRTAPSFPDMAGVALKIVNRLRQVYGVPQWGAPLSPVDELVCTILSQNTNDTNRDRAYQSLREKLPTWELVRDAPEDEVVAAIRTAGLANQKGRRIQTVLRGITKIRGVIDLDFLKDWSTEQAYGWLTQFPGVGPKTASIVLLFCFGRAVFPVDTHIYRVSGRLGLRPEAMSVEETHTHLGSLLPTEAFGAAHLNLIHLGREYCHPRQPACPTCPVQEWCTYYKKSIRNDA